MNGRIVLKGGFGFIGSAVARGLHAAGRPFEMLTYDNAATFPRDGVDLLIDCAGNSKKYLADRDPQYDYRKNVEEPVKTLRALNPRRFVYLSSSAVYADTSRPETTTELDEPPGDVSVYGQHKREAERQVRRLARNPLIVRPAGFFGPGLSKGPFYDLLEGCVPRLDASSQLQLLDVDLFAAAILAMAERGGTYNTVPSQPTVLAEVFPDLTRRQRDRWPGEKPSHVKFGLIGDRFAGELNRLGLAGRNLPEFAADYAARERRDCVPVLVLAGGLGTRMGGSVPKVILPIGGRPLIHHVVRPLVDAGYNQLVALLGHGGSQVASALAADELCRTANQIVESVPRGTGGAVVAALEKLSCETAIVINGDTLLRGLQVEELVKRHIRSGAAATLLAAPVDALGAFGRLDIRADGSLAAFGEKEHSGSGAAYAGVAVVDRRRLLAVGHKLGACSLERELLPRLIQADRVAAMLVPQVQFIDAGTPAGFAAAEQIVSAEQRVTVQPETVEAP
jgi:nucleoside-diphosphate-sugar epimerase/dTDP-glucose pyrophosphorylase